MNNDKYKLNIKKYIYIKNKYNIHHQSNNSKSNNTNQTNRIIILKVILSCNPSNSAHNHGLIYLK